MTTTTAKGNPVIDRSMSPAGNGTCAGSPRLNRGAGWGAVRGGATTAYDPAQPWSDYALDQAAWRVSIGTGTQADSAALAHQRGAA